MTDEPNVIDYLREQFARLHSRLGHTDTLLDEVIVRLGSVVRDIAGLKVAFAGMQVRLDPMTRKLDRIERRLELVEVQA